MEPKDWLAIAQVYATLALVQASIKTDGTTDSDEYGWLQEYVSKARAALRAAGVKDA